MTEPYVDYVYKAPHWDITEIGDMILMELVGFTDTPSQDPYLLGTKVAGVTESAMPYALSGDELAAIATAERMARSRIEKTWHEKWGPIDLNGLEVSVIYTRASALRVEVEYIWRPETTRWKGVDE